jgi:hypothetical protein
MHTSHRGFNSVSFSFWHISPISQEFYMHNPAYPLDSTTLTYFVECTNEEASRYSMCPISPCFSVTANCCLYTKCVGIEYC